MLEPCFPVPATTSINLASWKVLLSWVINWKEYEWLEKGFRKQTLRQHSLHRNWNRNTWKYNAYLSRTLQKNTAYVFSCVTSNLLLWGVVEALFYHKSQDTWEVKWFLPFPLPPTPKTKVISPETCLTNHQKGGNNRDSVWVLNLSTLQKKKRLKINSTKVKHVDAPMIFTH